MGYLTDDPIATYNQNMPVTVSQKEFGKVGHLGGRATFKKYGSSYMAKIGRKGGKKRWFVLRAGLKETRGGSIS